MPTEIFVKRAVSYLIDTGDAPIILLWQPRPPLLTGPLLIGPEFSLLLAVSVPHAHYVPLAVTVSHRYLVRRDKVCALALEMSDPMK